MPLKLFFNLWLLNVHIPSFHHLLAQGKYTMDDYDIMASLFALRSYFLTFLFFPIVILSFCYKIYGKRVLDTSKSLGA